MLLLLSGCGQSVTLWNATSPAGTSTVTVDAGVLLLGAFVLIAIVEALGRVFRK